MTTRQSTVERAFDLARNGTCRTIGQLRADLKAEQCEGVEGHLGSRSLVDQLRAIMKSKTASQAMTGLCSNIVAPTAKQA